MNAALDSMIAKYDPTTSDEWVNALREVIQELALLGLWRARFYEHAAFYGGTALRIFHGLNRFSEDLDFSLLTQDGAFDLSPYLEAIRKELAAFDFTFIVEQKSKQIDTAIDSAFIKGSTRINLIEIGAPKNLQDRFPASQNLKIKLEVDTIPPPGANYVVETILVPIPFQVRLFDLPSLFAGKLHAVLCRNWKNRVKGRDYYDLVWYLGRGVTFDIDHLKARMVQTSHWAAEDELSLDAVKNLLKDKFATVDFEQAKDDVLPFLEDPDSVTLWNLEFFESLLNRLLSKSHL